MSRRKKLYIEFRLHYDPQANQDIIHEIGQVLQERIHDLVEGEFDEESSGPIPAIKDVTYEVVSEWSAEDDSEVDSVVAVMRDREWKVKESDGN
jgi:hypothetical protein